MRLYVIPGGTMRIDKGAVFTPGIDDGVLIDIPVPVYLIRTDNGENVLVDTGLHPAHIDDPSHSFGVENADTILPRMQPEDRLERSTRRDRSRARRHHPRCQHPPACRSLWRQLSLPPRRAHRPARALRRGARAPRDPDELFHRPELHYRLLDGDEQLFSGVRAIVVSGHARGLQALLVSLPQSGSILIAGDAIDTAEHLERDLWTHCPDPELARESAQRLQRIAAEEDALLLYGHDAAQWQTLRLSPRFYD